MTLPFLALLLALADEADLARQFREKGATVVETKGSISSVEASDCSKWTDADFGQLGQLPHLRNLSLGPGLNDGRLSALSGLPELDTLQTNLADVTDDGIKPLAKLPKLKILKFFHPGKSFSGSGLAHLAEAPSLERLTVAGSLAFGDEGMAAVAKLERLKELRTWHAGQTLEGVRRLVALKNLKSLTLGQRLAYKPPTTLSDESIPVLLDLKSLEFLRLEEARLHLDSLVRLKELPDLKKLELEGIDLPESDVERLRKELPKVDIRWTKPNEVYLKRIKALFDTN